jgi:hypothetical protein
MFVCLVAEAIALKLRRPGLGARSYLYAQIFTGISYISASFLLFELWRSRRTAAARYRLDGDSTELAEA